MPLNGRNYIPWAKAAKVTLKGKGLLGYINGKKVRPLEGTEGQEEWDMIDSQTMTFITNSLEPQLSESFCYCETAAQLWHAIEKQYSSQKSHSQIYHLKKEIASISQESRDIPELIGFVTAKYEEMNLYRPPTTDLSVLREREETDRVYTFLAALDPSYEAIRAQLLLSTDKLSFDEVTARIRQEATRRIAMGTSDSNPKSEGHAFTARYTSSGRTKGKGEVERCSHCKRDGHTNEKCWVLHPHLRPKKGDRMEAAKKGGFQKTLELREGKEGEKYRNNAYPSVRNGSGEGDKGRGGAYEATESSREDASGSRGVAATTNRGETRSDSQRLD